MTTNVDPPHDRVRLSEAERRVIAGLEHDLAEEERAAAGWSTRILHTGGLVVGQVYRRAPWLLPLSLIAMLALTSVSALAGAVGALVAGTLASMVVWQLCAAALPHVRAWRDSYPPPDDARRQQR